jgi:hypothetical protein
MRRAYASIREIFFVGSNAPLLAKIKPLSNPVWITERVA